VPWGGSGGGRVYAKYDVPPFLVNVTSVLISNFEGGEVIS